ncbi:MAG TPA: nickel pincer cofactor biosynthesis protein LarB, partial [Ignavibacteria bacterium]
MSELRRKKNSLSNSPSSTLRTHDYIDLGFAKYDLKREKIKGFPEVILAQGKDEKHLVSIAYNAVQKTNRLLITRVNKKQYLALKKKFRGSKIHQPVYYETARLVYIGKVPKTKIGKVVVVCAGTADLPVAEEATFSLEIFGSNVVRLYDVGVAGLHRLLSNANVFENTNVIIVVAGMEGALASVVTGLVSVPVIAVPTSVGYGASFNGLAPLLTMLNSCSAGISVVNIDNGFGAAFQAH